MSLPTSLDSYILLGNSGLRVSPLCLGTMTFGEDWGWGSDRETAKQVFERYAEAGGNFLDTANFYTYGTSEELVGEFIARDRERFVVSSKYTINMKTGGGREGQPDPNAGGNQRKNMMQSVEASLKRLGTDYIDVFWLHMWDYSTPVDELMRGFDDLVRQGKINYVAISDTPAWKIAQLQTYAQENAVTRIIATQVAYSLVRRDVERDILPMCRELGIGLLPWSPLAGGVLTGKYSREDLAAQREAAQGSRFGSNNRTVKLSEEIFQVVDAVREVAQETGKSPSQVALNWLLTRKGVSSLIIGARTLSQLEDNLACLEFSLDESLLEKLEQASAIELGFPHDFLSSVRTGDIVTGRAKIAFRQ